MANEYEHDNSAGAQTPPPAEAPTGDHYEDQEHLGGEPEGEVEPLGCQVCRHLKNDLQALMVKYDEVMPLLEHEHVQAHLQDVLGSLEGHITGTEKLHAKHYKEFPPLEDEDMDEGEEGDEEEPGDEDDGQEDEDAEDDEDEDDKEKEREDDAEEDKEDAEEAAEGMEGEGMARKKKHLCGACAAKHSKGFPPGEDTDLGDEEDSHGPGTDLTGGEIPGEPGGEEFQDKPGEGLDPRDHETAREAHAFLGHVSQEASQFGDAERMEAHHLARATEHFAELDRAAEAAGVQEGGEKDMEGGDGEFHKNMGCGDMGKALGRAHHFFKGLAQERAFGDRHRQEALAHHEALGPYVKAGDDEMSGEMGEKAAPRPKAPKREGRVPARGQPGRLVNPQPANKRKLDDQKKPPNEKSLESLKKSLEADRRANEELRESLKQLQNVFN